MAPLPKKKHSHSRTAKRRSTFKAFLSGISKCKACNKLKEPHKACPHCGVYKQNSTVK